MFQYFFEYIFFECIFFEGVFLECIFFEGVFFEGVFFEGSLRIYVITLPVINVARIYVIYFSKDDF